MSLPTSPRSLVVIGCVLVTAACSVAGLSGLTNMATTGTIMLTITDTVGGTPHVAITGPGSYSTTVTSSGAISNLTTGSYTIVADSIEVGPDSIVGNAVDTGSVVYSPAYVNAGETSYVTIDYEHANRGGMWVANLSSANVVDYSANQLHKSGSAQPAATLTTPCMP